MAGREPVIAGENAGAAQGSTPAIVFHSLPHATAALRAAAACNTPVTLLSPPDAGIYSGARWFSAATAEAGRTVPQARFTEILDCGDDAGAAQAAIDAGIRAIVFAGSRPVMERLRVIAEQRRIVVLDERPPVLLDLEADFFVHSDVVEMRCADALARNAAFC